jgi:predicted ribosome quality control (RQC) complex YloA/Tae2 family protein
MALGGSERRAMQAVDFTVLSAVSASLEAEWIPARLEQVRQDEYQTVQLLLRNFSGQCWLLASCHIQAARIHFGNPSKGRSQRLPFGAALYQYLGGKFLIACEQPAWERVLCLRFAHRPEVPAEFTLYVEAMGKYSNIVLTDEKGEILALAHSISSAQSRVRPVQLGEIYAPPPPLSGPMPSLSETLESWRERLSLVPGNFASTLQKNYRGVSKVLTLQMLREVHLPETQNVEALGNADWQKLYQLWCNWQLALKKRLFLPAWSNTGYTVLGWDQRQGGVSVGLHDLLDSYYSRELGSAVFTQRRQRLQQVLRVALTKASKRLSELDRMAVGAEKAEIYKQQADLLMANLALAAPGLKAVTVLDFETEQPITLSLDPAKDMVGNAQSLYKKHRKAKRANQSLAPLVTQARQEVAYLEQVTSTVELLDDVDDLEALIGVEVELGDEGYLKRTEKVMPETTVIPFHQFVLPNHSVVLVGRNNRQNDRLTFEVASPEDLWFHAQEIPGSHVILRKSAGQALDQDEIQWAANVAAYFSRSRASAYVPVIYTERRLVRKLKGGKPGLVTFKEEKVIWGNPHTLPERKES